MYKRTHFFSDIIFQKAYFTCDGLDPHPLPLFAAWASFFAYPSSSQNLLPCVSTAKWTKILLCPREIPRYRRKKAFPLDLPPSPGPPSLLSPHESLSAGEKEEHPEIRRKLGWGRGKTIRTGTYVYSAQLLDKFSLPVFNFRVTKMKGKPAKKNLPKNLLH